MMSKDVDAQIAQAYADFERGRITSAEYKSIRARLGAHRRIPNMPDGVKLIRFWPVHDPAQIVGYPLAIVDVRGLIFLTIKRLACALRHDHHGAGNFSTEGLVARLALLGVLIEVDVASPRGRQAAVHGTVAQSQKTKAVTVR